MAAEALLLVVALLFAVVAPFVLLKLVESERNAGTEMRRDDAERAARRDTRDDARR